jgi:hypothetical protein
MQQVVSASCELLDLLKVQHTRRELAREPILQLVNTLLKVPRHLLRIVFIIGLHVAPVNPTFKISELVDKFTNSAVLVGRKLRDDHVGHYPLCAKLCADSMGKAGKGREMHYQQNAATETSHA